MVVVVSNNKLVKLRVFCFFLGPTVDGWMDGYSYQTRRLNQTFTSTSTIAKGWEDTKRTGLARSIVAQHVKDIFFYS